MRIAVVASSEISGGAEEYLHRLYSQFRRCFDAEPYLVGALPRWSEEVGDVYPAGVTPKLTRRRPLLRQSVSAVASVPEILAEISRIDPDVVHIQYFKEKLTLPILLKRRGYPVVWTEHAPLPNNFPPGATRILRRQALSATVIAISDGVTKSLSDAGISSTLIRNPLPEIPSTPVGAVRVSVESAGSVVYLGRLHRNKRVDLLVAAARLLPAVPFEIAGDGPELVRLKREAPANVTFHGHVSDPSLILRRARLVVITSGRPAREGAPLAMLEARAAGKRVLMAEDCHAMTEAASLGCASFAPDANSLARSISAMPISDSPLSEEVRLERSLRVWAEAHYRVMATVKRDRTTSSVQELS